MTDMTVREIAGKLAARELSASEIAKAYLDRIARIDSKVGSYLTVDAEETLRWAERAQGKLDAGEGNPLTGVPIALKDNLSTNGMRTTCASKILETYVPPYDATVVARLREAGATALGKTNLDEFAMGGSNEYSGFFPCRNPWDLTRSPGGSSGGSAAAVAAGLAPVALGSDTGGSVRLPAAFCGLVGYKPTYGRFSRYGLVAFASSLDQIGVLSQTVEDCAIVTEIVSGHDPRDNTSLPEGPIVADVPKGSLKGLKLAAPKQLLDPATVQPGVLDAMHRAIDTLTREGAQVTEVDLPVIHYAVSMYYIIAPAEASSNLARFDGVRYGPRIEDAGHVNMVGKTRGTLFGHEVKSRIMIGTYVLSAGYYDAFYKRAQQLRARLTGEFDALFADYDFVIGPGAPCVAFTIGAFDEDPLAMKLLDACTIPANMGGYPAITVPCGLVDGLPVAIQLMGPRSGDEKLLQAAAAAEKALPSASPRPKLE